MPTKSGKRRWQAKQRNQKKKPTHHATSIKSKSKFSTKDSNTIMKHILIIAFVTAFWYFSSSINAVATQKLFQGLRDVLDDDFSSTLLVNGEKNVDHQKEIIVLLAVVLTLLQLCMGGILSMVFLFILGRQTAPYQQQQQSCDPPRNNQIHSFYQQFRKQDIIIGLFHCIASICTNIGYGYGSASLVQVVKLLEPVETLLLSALVQKTLEGLSFKKVTSTMAIIAGTFMLLSNPLIEVNPTSVMFAIGSGICMASRNVLSKECQKPDAESAALSPEAMPEARTFEEILVKGMQNFANITITAAISALVVSFFMVLYSFQLLKTLIPQLLHVSPEILNQTVIFHCLYNMASITVLSLTSATSHSLLNVGKRIANVTIVSMVFNIPLTSSGKIGLVVAAIGAFFYNDNLSLAWQNKVSFRQKWYLVITVILFYLQLHQSMDLTSHQQTNIVLPEAVINNVVSVPTPVNAPPVTWLVPDISRNLTRKQKVVLLGPHDRYNFGDLIFSKVIAKLLISRAGYLPDEILYGGIVSVNMSTYGGPPNVLTMKQIQNRSRSDTVHGPYDIIFTGGEALGCTFDCALNMMRTQELRSQAKREKIHDCGYLFPKRLLLPLDHNRSDVLSNYAVVNSMGGPSVMKACKEAVQTADYVAYRDCNPLFPDSAVMTKELFSDEINKAATEVLQDLRLGANQKFVAVQHKSGSMTTPELKKKLAVALDAVARGLNATVIFFAAGTVPGHDSFKSYQDVAKLMGEDAIVYEAENMWNVIGLISRADAILSTSLHVRIMAFIYFKPRVTWCGKPGKHSRFISMWDSNTSAPCVQEKNYTLDVLREHYLKNPDIAREMTIATYKTLVKKYLESFSNYSKLLRPQIGH